MVFLHGDGVEMVPQLAATDAEKDADWVVCRTSWRRRFADEAPPRPFRVATLVTFYAAVLSAGRVDSVGLGGRLCCKRVEDGCGPENSLPLVLDIGFRPADPRQHRETLEMALGAAALELDASVVFHGGGRHHLAGDAARGWSQVTDFDLLELWVEDAPNEFEADIFAQTLDAADALELRTGTATILIL